MSQPETIHDFDDGIDVRPDSADGGERFTIQNDAQAAWAMRKLLSYQSKRDENARIAEAERQRIDAWLERQNAKDQSDVNYFTGMLVQYAERQRREEGRKSIETPYGTVKTRQGQPKWLIDEAEFIPWARENHPEFVRVKEEADLSAMKKALEIAETDSLGTVAIDDDGQVIPGVSVTPPTISITVEVEK